MSIGNFLTLFISSGRLSILLSPCEACRKKVRVSKHFIGKRNKYSLYARLHLYLPTFSTHGLTWILTDVIEIFSMLYSCEIPFTLRRISFVIYTQQVSRNINSYLFVTAYFIVFRKFLVSISREQRVIIPITNICHKKP